MLRCTLLPQSITSLPTHDVAALETVRCTASSPPSGKLLHGTGAQARPAPAALRCPLGRSGAGWCRQSRTACARPRAPPGAWARAGHPRPACHSQTSHASGAAQHARLGPCPPVNNPSLQNLLARVLPKQHCCTECSVKAKHQHGTDWAQRLGTMTGHKTGYIDITAELEQWGTLTVQKLTSTLDSGALPVMRADPCFQTRAADAGRRARLQARAVEVDQVQVPVGLELEGRSNLLSRVACAHSGHFSTRDVRVRFTTLCPWQPCRSCNMPGDSCHRSSSTGCGPVSTRSRGDRRRVSKPTACCMQTPCGLLYDHSAF